MDIHLIDHTGRTSIIDSRDLDGRKYQLSDGRRQANLQMTTSIEQRHWKKSLTILPPKAIQVFPLVKAKPQMLMKPKLRSSSCLWPEALIGTSTVDGLSECCKSVATTGSTCCLGSCSNSIVLVDSNLLLAHRHRKRQGWRDEQEQIMFKEWPGGAAAAAEENFPS